MTENREPYLVTLSEDAPQVSPEQRITNVVERLQELITSPRHPGRQRQIIEGITAMGRLWPRYRDGELPWLVGDREVPF